MGLFSKLFGDKPDAEFDVRKERPIRFKANKNLDWGGHNEYDSLRPFPIIRPGDETPTQRRLAICTWLSNDVKEKMLERCAKAYPDIRRQYQDHGYWHDGKITDGEDDFLDYVSAYFWVTIDDKDFKADDPVYHYDMMLQTNMTSLDDRAIAVGAIPEYIKIPLTDAEIKNFCKEMEVVCNARSEGYLQFKDPRRHMCGWSTKYFQNLQFGPARRDEGLEAQLLFDITSKEALVKALQEYLVAAKEQIKQNRNDFYYSENIEKLLELLGHDDSHAYIQVCPHSYQNNYLSIHVKREGVLKAGESDLEGRYSEYLRFQFYPDIEKQLTCMLEASMGKTLLEAAKELYSVLSDRDKQALFKWKLNDTINKHPELDYDAARRYVCEHYKDYIYSDLLNDMRKEEAATAKMVADTQRAKAALDAALGSKNKPAVSKNKKSYFTKD